MHHEGFNWFSFLPGFDFHYVHVYGAVAISLLLIAVTLVARAQLARVTQSQGGGLVPENRMTFRNFFEIIAEALYGLCESVMGDKLAKKFFPLIGCLFLFIFSCNVLGLIPGFLPPTDNFNTTLALGIFVFVFYNYLGIKEHGAGYIKHFMGPVWWLAPLLFVIELVSHVVRPFALGMRLRGNIMGDHMVLSIFNEITPWLVPVIFNFVGLFVCFIQAFVFCLLTMIYFSLATSHDH